MKPPAFQFYASDFIVGVMGMSDEEVGIYIKMLAFQWVKGGLPIEPTAIKKLIGSRKLPTESVLEKFTLGDDGKIRNMRLEVERDKQATYRESRAENAKRGWQKRSTSNAHASVCTSTVHDVCNALQSSSSPSGISPLPPSEILPLCTIEQAIDKAKEYRMSEPAARYWWHTRNAAGWTKSSASGGHPRRITSWQSDLAGSSSWAEEGAHKQPRNNTNGNFKSSDVGIS